MALSDLFFATDFFNRLGRKNIRGDELAAMLGGAGVSGSAAVMSSSSGQNVLPGVQTVLTFPIVRYDDLTFTSAANRFTIPAGVSRVLLHATISASGLVTQNETTSWRINGAFVPVNRLDLGFENVSDGAAGHMKPSAWTWTTLPINVVAGDFFEVVAFQLGVAQWQIGQRHAGISVIK